MFAPYCPTCDHRVLLGPRCLVLPPPQGRGPGPFVRCHCGAVLDALAEHPAPRRVDPAGPARSGAGASASAGQR